MLRLQRALPDRRDAGSAAGLEHRALRYEIDALRGLLIGTPSDLGLDFAVLLVACTAGIATSSRLLRRLTQ